MGEIGSPQDGCREAIHELTGRQDLVAGDPEVRVAATAGFAVGFAAIGLALAAGDLTAQAPIEVAVTLGSADGALAYSPRDLTFETSKLYKLVLTNPSPRPHYFTAPDFAAKVHTRKVQVMSAAGPQGKALGEIKGTIRELEVHPGGTLEWWFVPIATGTNDPMVCGIKDPDGKTHLEKGMTGSIMIK